MCGVLKVVIFRWLSIVFVVLCISACKPEAPEQEAGGGSKVLTTGFTLSQAEFNSLSPDDQFMTVNKALSTMYRGLPMDEFFDLPLGLENPVIKQSNIINTLQHQLKTPLSQSELSDAYNEVFGLDDDPETEADDSIPARFTNFDNEHPHQRYMARVQGYPISKDMFSYWMSYFLANTIMFSPAREMDSANSQDIARVLGYLQETIEKDTPIRDTIRGWLHNLSRWRVSRSAENHALEMFELYLGMFNDSEEEQRNTINGGIACSEWYLTDNNADYQLLKNFDTPDAAGSVKVFDNYISDCDGLYDLVAGHPYLMPRVIEVIVNYFLDGSSASAKQSLISDVLSTGPVTFEDVFMPIIFSKEFLLRSQRPKTFEENAFNFLGMMHWSPRSNQWNGSTCRYSMGREIFDYLLDSTNNGYIMGLHNMGWVAMDAKIGRTPFLPMDVLSFATYHKAMRECVVMDNRAFDGYGFPEETDFTEAATPREPPFEIKNGAFYIAGTENLKSELEDLTVNEFIDFVFLTALGRRASDEEVAAFLLEGGPDIRNEANELTDDNRNFIQLDEDGIWQHRKTDGDLYWEDQADNFAEIMLDYISRLPEFYYFKAVSQ